MPRRAEKDETAPTNERDRADYQTLDLLDRLEELLEAMDELGVSSRDEIEQRIEELEAQLGDGEPTDDGVTKSLSSAGGTTAHQVQP